MGSRTLPSVIIVGLLFLMTAVLVADSQNKPNAMSPRREARMRALENSPYLPVQQTAAKTGQAFRASSATTFTVTNTADSGPGSLRDAILNANSNPGTDTIVFNIPAAGVQTIFPLSQLPPLTDPSGVVIDGLSQPGATCGANPPSSAILLIQISGTMAGAAHGLWVTSNGNEIRGLIINDFEQDGICIEGGIYNEQASFNWVHCNFIGTDSTGTVDVGNGRNLASLWAGVMIKQVEGGYAFENMIEENLISGNYAEGIAVWGPVLPGDVYQNHLNRNYIGTDITGTVDLGNDHEGICLCEGTHDNDANENLISGNDYDGVGIQGYNNIPYGPPIQTSRNVIAYNTIGLDINLNPLPNSMAGVTIGEYGPSQWGCADYNVVANNTIASNNGDGVSVWEDGVNNTNADQNIITQNAIYNNGGLGIDLDNDGVSMNDPSDPDSTANQRLNFPVIDSAIYNTATSTTTVYGTIDIDTPPQNATVEVFKASPDPSGYGEGQQYLGSTTPNNIGQWTYVDATLAVGDNITATTTDQNSNTSEFAAVVTVTEQQPEPDTCEYYKPGYVDFCPNGMPDFDQKQDQWVSPITGNWSWCGPVALANCIWWFDSKFEPSPLDPRPFFPGPGNPPLNDGYPLIPTFDPNGVWDDHDTNNVMPFIQALMPMCNTDVTVPGTLPIDLQNGFQSWLASVGLTGQYTTYLIEGPEFEEIRDSILSCQDVILLLGFYELLDEEPFCQWIGGHYVTAAGVCTTTTDICISDPYFDKNEGEPPAGSAHGSSVHNDASLVSGPHGSIHHDRYNLQPNTSGCPSPAKWMFTNYPNNWADIWVFENENPLVPMPGPVTYTGGPIVVLLDAALIICPVEPQPQDTCEYYKSPYEDYSPYGVPDFDQKQDGWRGIPFNGWSYCGPVALANCFWWMDSRFDSLQNPPPTVSDAYPLVQSYVGAAVDDHSPSNVIPFVDSLAAYSNCNPGTAGTWIMDLYNGAQAWIASRGLNAVNNDLQVKLIPSPTFDTIKSELMDCEDVILLLGFYEDQGGGECCRLGGHYVTVAGVCTTDVRICISDPYFDKNEGEPPAGSAHGSAVHNDAQYISGPHGQIQHDPYNIGPNPMGCAHPQPPAIELTDYPDNWNDISNFAEMNQTEPAMPYCPYGNGTIYTLVDYALVISPCCKVRGDADHSSSINVADLTFLVNYLFKGGPPPPCIEEGDADSSGGINVADLTYLVAYLFKGGPAPQPCP